MFSPPPCQIRNILVCVEDLLATLVGSATPRSTSFVASNARSLAHARRHPHTVAMGNSPRKDGTVRRRCSTRTVWPVPLVEAEAGLGIRIAERSIHAQRTGLLVELQQAH